MRSPSRPGFRPGTCRSTQFWIHVRFSDEDQIAGYTRCGDSALWTGAYLAAEAFRYKVTQSADAFNNVKTALAGLKALADVTGDIRGTTK